MAWYHSFYTDEELTRTYQSFRKDHLQRKTGQVDNRTAFIRIFCILLMSLSVAFIISRWGPFRLIVFMTNWALCLTIFWVLVSLYISRVPTASMHMLAINHLLFSVVLPMNFLVLSVYWTVLHKKVMEEYGHDPGVKRHSYFVHITPSVCAVVNFLLTDVVIKPSHAKLLLPIAVVYSYINYKSTLSRGKPVYWFLDWEDHWTIIYLVLLTIMTTLAFLGMAGLTY